MSASWASDPRVRPLSAALALALLLVAPVDPAAARTTRPDSARAITSIRVSDEGIRIRGGGGLRGDTTLEIVDRPGRADAKFDIGGQKVRIRGDVAEPNASGKDVRIVGPVVLVNGQGADMVRVCADAEVPAGQRIEGDVVAVFGSVTVKGEVAGNAVAVFGTLRLEPGAVVDGDAVAVGGSLDQQPGATVSGQSVSIEPGFDCQRLPGLLLGSAGLLTVLLLVLLVPALVGWLFLVIAPDRMLRVSVTAAQRPFVSLLLGLVAGPLAVVAFVLLLITVVGIPIALLLPVLFGLMSWAGQVATTYVIGCRLLRRRLGAGGSLGPYVTGTLFVAAIVAVGVASLVLPGPLKPVGIFLLMVAILLGAGLGLIGTGATLLSKLGSTPRDVHRHRVATPDAAGLP